jgi:hypothetical protein
MTAAVFVALFAWPVLALMSAPEFRPAAPIVPVILAAFVVQIWTDVVALGIEVSEKTRYATYATSIGAAASLIFYALLIPPPGMGAAPTSLGFSVRLFFHRLPRLGRSREIGRCAARRSPPRRRHHLRAPTGYVSQAAVAAGFFALYAWIVWSVVLQPSERERIGSFLRRPRRTFLAMTTP